MRIAINALAMKRELYGVGNYIKHLVKSLAEIDSENEYLVFATAQSSHHLTDLGRNFHIELAPSNRAVRLLWEQTALPLKLELARIDVYHGPTFVAPLFKTCRQIVSILDMTFYQTPERHSWHKRIYFRSMIPRMVAQSDRIIAISESTKHDLCEVLNLRDSGKISVIHLGVDPRFRPITEPRAIDTVRSKYSLPHNFILFVGLIEPRKNLESLVEAYQSISAQSECDLVVAGNLGWGYSRLLEKIKNSPVRDRIHRIGYVADTDLPTLYSMAAAFVYPSVYEGFGLPVLEAMACGAPVITSQMSSLPEVAGDAAICVNPFDCGSLASALWDILVDENLRRSLIQRGRARSLLFTWEKTAQKTLELYNSMCINEKTLSQKKI